MLEQPQNLTDADLASIKELTETFPYFAPARYLQAAQQHKEQRYSPDMMARMQLFSANWLMYNEYLQAATGEPYNDEEVVITQPQEVSTAPIAEEPEAVVAEEPITEEPIQEEEIIEEEVVAATPEEETPAASIDDGIAEDFTTINTGFIRGRKKEQSEPAKEQQEHLASAIRNTPPYSKNQKQGEKNENLIPPIYTEDYFLHQGVHVSNDLPEDLGTDSKETDTEQSLMVVMSFSEWLIFYKKRKQQEQEEEKDQRELKSMWQKQKLAAAMEEENEEIPENVFEMAVNSIAKEEGLVSESLAEVMVKQGRYDRAIDMYKKLSLRKPQKKAYFARKIEEILKEK